MKEPNTNIDALVANHMIVDILAVNLEIAIGTEKTEREGLVHAADVPGHMEEATDIGAGQTVDLAAVTDIEIGNTNVPLLAITDLPDHPVDLTALSPTVQDTQDDREVIGVGHTHLTFLLMTTISNVNLIIK